MPNLNYPGPETIHRHVLPNGLTLLVYENFANESVVIEGFVRTGSLLENRETAGLAEFTAVLLTRGTQQRTFEQIFDELEAVGATLSFGGGRHVSDFSGYCLAEDLDLVLEIMGECLRTPTFPEEKVELARGQLLTNLQMRANDTGRMAALRFAETTYPNHPYGRSINGYPETIARLSRADLAQFHHETYGPQGMVLALVGAVRAAEIVEKVTAVLGDWQNPAQRPLPPVPTAPRPAQLTRVHVPMPGKSQSDLIMGLPGPARNTPDYLDVSMMNTILGVFGMMGRIGQTVREEQGLAYYAYSQLQGGLGPGAWLATAGVAPENVEQTIESIRAQIERIQNEPVSPEELDESKAYRTGSVPVGLETNSGLAGSIVDMELYGLGLDFLQRYPDLIAEITAERVQKAAQTYLSPDQMVVVVAGPVTNDDTE